MSLLERGGLVDVGVKVGMNMVGWVPVMKIVNALPE